VSKIEVRELSCNEIKKYYRKHHDRLLTQSDKKAVTSHFSKCGECRKNYLNWLHNIFQKERKEYSSF